LKKGKITGSVAPVWKSRGVSNGSSGRRNEGIKPSWFGKQTKIVEGRAGPLKKNKKKKKKNNDNEST